MPAGVRLEGVDQRVLVACLDRLLGFPNRHAPKNHLHNGGQRRGGVRGVEPVHLSFLQVLDNLLGA